MGVPDAPQWLVPAFVRSVMALGATEPRERIAATGEALLERWSTPDRHHHGVRHLVHVLECADTLSQEVHNPEMVRVAAWYHGAVFDATIHEVYRRAAGENKEASAALAKEQLLDLGVSPKVARRVHDLILALAGHDADPSDVDAMALCDADLGALATEPQKYREYRKRVRTEFSRVSEEDYRQARIAVITKLLARRQIFVSPHAAAWEAPARQNLEAELARLTALTPGSLPAAPGAPSAASPAPAAPSPARASAPSASSPATLGQDALAEPRREARAQAERFSPDTSYTADDTTVLGMEPDSRKPLRGRPAPGSDEPECIGVPFEERAEAARDGDSRLLSAMEKDPVDPATLPRRVAVEDARKKADKAREGVSTGRPRDEESTGTLFRPLDR